jgi:hypothetical protein
MIVGILLGLTASAPLFLYAYWSWRVVREYARRLQSGAHSLTGLAIWTRFVLWAFLVGMAWPIWAFVPGLFGALLYAAPNLTTSERAFTQSVVELAFWPIYFAPQVAGSLSKLLIQTADGWVLWPLLAVCLATPLLAISGIQWLHFRHRVKTLSH